MARELGNNIPRMKVLKPERRVLKRHGKEDSSVVMTEEMEDVSSAEDLSLLVEEEKEEKEDSSSQLCLKEVDMANISTNSPSPFNTISSSISTSISSSLSPADSEEYSADSVCTDTSDVTDRETDISVQHSPPPAYEIEEIQEKKKSEVALMNTMEFGTEVVTEVVTETDTDADAEDKSILQSTEDGKCNTLPSIPNQSLNHIMDPNEPVYMGSKKYEKLFIFWQVSSFLALLIDIFFFYGIIYRYNRTLIAHEFISQFVTSIYIYIYIYSSSVGTMQDLIKK